MLCRLFSCCLRILRNQYIETWLLTSRPNSHFHCLPFRRRYTTIDQSTSQHAPPSIPHVIIGTDSTRTYQSTHACVCLCVCMRAFARAPVTTRYITHSGFRIRGGGTKSINFLIVPMWTEHVLSLFLFLSLSVVGLPFTAMSFCSTFSHQRHLPVHPN